MLHHHAYRLPDSRAVNDHATTALITGGILLFVPTSDVPAWIFYVFGGLLVLYGVLIEIEDRTRKRLDALTDV